MPLAVAARSSSELAARAAGKPVVLVRNALQSYQTAAVWGANATSWTAAAGASNADTLTHPTRFAWDWLAGVQTYPTIEIASGISSCAIFMDLDDSAGHVIDSCVIAGHNFADLAADLTITLVFADSDDFTTNAITAYTWSLTAPHSNQRLVALNLEDSRFATENRRFSSIRYARLTIVASANYSLSTVPRIGELFLGRQVQLFRQHDTPGDIDSQMTAKVYHEAEGGQASGYTLYSGRRDIDVSWTADQNDTYGDDVAQHDLWWTETRNGQDGFFYIPDPDSPERAPLLYLPGPVHRKDWQGPYHVSLGGKQMLEQPPFISSETA